MIWFTDKETTVDIDLNRWSAENVMGWEKHETFYATWIDKQTEKFPVELSSEFVFTGEDRAEYKQEDWHPLTDWNQLKLVIEKMRELGWHFSLYSDKLGIGCVFYPYPYDGKERRINRSNDLPTTVLQAAKEALEEKCPT